MSERVFVTCTAVMSTADVGRAVRFGRRNGLLVRVLNAGACLLLPGDWIEPSSTGLRNHQAGGDVADNLQKPTEHGVILPRRPAAKIPVMESVMAIDPRLVNGCPQPAES